MVFKYFCFVFLIVKNFVLIRIDICFIVVISLLFKSVKLKSKTTYSANTLTKINALHYRHLLWCFNILIFNSFESLKLCFKKLWHNCGKMRLKPCKICCHTFLKVSLQIRENLKLKHELAPINLHLAIEPSHLCRGARNYYVKSYAASVNSGLIKNKTNQQN